MTNEKKIIEYCLTINNMFQTYNLFQRLKD